MQAHPAIVLLTLWSTASFVALTGANSMSSGGSSASARVRCACQSSVLHYWDGDTVRPSHGQVASPVDREVPSPTEVHCDHLGMVMQHGFVDLAGSRPACAELHGSDHDRSCQFLLRQVPLATESESPVAELGLASGCIEPEGEGIYLDLHNSQVVPFLYR